MKGRLTALTLAGALLCTAVTACARSAGAQPVTATVLAMDTVMNFTLYGGADLDPQTLQDALSGAQDTVQQLSDALSAQSETGEAFALNAGDGAWVELPRSGQLLKSTLELSALTGGALDPTAYAAVRTWGFVSGEYRVPDEEELAILADAVDYTRVEVSEDGTRARMAPGQALDFGATAKGWAGDVLKEQLTGAGVKSALLDLGQSSIAALGAKPDGSPWRIGIQDPAAESGEYLGILELTGRCMGTSGSYQRYFEQDGVRYCHIMDPATAAPARSGLAGVTVVADSCLLCDGLSTALFVMGVEKGAEFWRQHPELDFEVLFITEDGELYATPGFLEGFTLEQGETRKVQVLE